MRQRNAKWIASFAMIAGVSAVSVRAEEVEIEDVTINLNSKNEIEDNVVNSKNEVEDNELELRNRVSGLGNSLQASPVIVTPAMAPTTQIPVALAPATALPSTALYQTQQTGGQESANAALTEGTSQSSNSNAGSGAMVIINNTQDQKAAQDQASEQAVGTRADMIRRERIRRELLNEGRLIEKIEENRIDTENRRSDSIEGMTFGAGSGGLESTEVVAVDGNNNNVEVVTAQVAGSSVVATEASDSSHLFGREVKVSPIAGYRWMTDNNSAFRVENQFIAGVALESKLANWVSLEANYIFGRDKLRERGGYGGSYYGAGHMGYDDYGYGGYDNMAYYVRERDSHEFSGNMKIGLLSGTVRPYGIVGIGMLLQKYRIDDQYTTAEASAAGWKRLFDDTVGNYGGGVDVKAGSNIAVGARVEYQKVYGSKNTNLNDLYGHTEDRVRATGSVSVLF
jgi:hypothetical protein